MKDDDPKYPGFPTVEPFGPSNLHLIRRGMWIVGWIGGLSCLALLIGLIISMVA